MTRFNRALVFIFGKDPRIKMEILGLFLLMMAIPLLAGNGFSRESKPIKPEPSSIKANPVAMSDNR